MFADIFWESCTSQTGVIKWSSFINLNMTGSRATFQKYELIWPRGTRIHRRSPHFRPKYSFDQNVGLILWVKLYYELEVWNRVEYIAI